MARLPTPGSDNGSWGTVLNDFLSQSLDANGALKPNAVGSSNLQDGSVTASKIPDGSITVAKLAPGASSNETGLRSLFIFYSPPNIINGRFSDDYAAGTLSRYGDVILGGGLEDSGNAYHASTVSIIQKVATLGTDTVLWGYIDVGVTTSNLSLATLHTQIDQWIAMGIDGIFCDLVGYDYGVSRARQNDIINYIHDKGLSAFLNVWNMDDLLSPAVNITYNPGGVATAANSTDAVLLESWICNTDAYTSPYYSTFSDIKTRGDKAVAYRASMGIRLYATNIFNHTGHNLVDIQTMHDYTNAFARVWRLNGSGLAAANYGSTGVDLGIAKPLYSALRETPLRPSAPYSLNNTWTQIDATDLGISVVFDPGTSTYTWSQD